MWADLPGCAGLRPGERLFAAVRLKKFTYPAALDTFIFKNWHFNLSSTKNRGDWIRTSDLLVPNQAL
jgi:hypothetical protein